MNQMQTSQFATVSEYLDTCYTDGFIGTIFDAHGQGVPILAPIDQEAMVRAVQLESKISKGLYTRLGKDVNLLKAKITAQVSRGIASGMTYAQVAKQLENQSRIGFNRAVRIARTEGHRIQTTATMDAMTAAKEKGADVLKQWDATLDNRTRESHQAVDGEIRELDKPFSNGLMFAGDPSGRPEEVINCRCAVLQRARWALGEDELQTLKDRAAYYGLDKSKEFDDFKKKYLNATNSEKVLTNSGKSDKIKSPDIQIGRSIGAKAQNFDIELPNKEIVHLTEGTRITGIETIAGKGRNRQIDEIDLLIEQFGGTASEWQKKKGFGYVDYQGESYRARLHWYEEPTVGRHKWKVKPDADGNWFIEDGK